MCWSVMSSGVQQLQNFPTPPTHPASPTSSVPMRRKPTYMTHLKFKHASTHTRTLRVVGEKEEDQVILCKKLKKKKGTR